MAVILWVNSAARADIVAVLFTGFNPDNPSGMDFFNDYLTSSFASDFPAETWSSQVFGYDQRIQAFDFINGHSQVDELFLVGHSWGGNALIRLATNLLLPAGIGVDATFQIDSVDIFDSGLPDDVLPSNVDYGYNFYQIPTGFLEPGGEQDVAGALNVNAEDFFHDPTITHTSIDNDSRLHELFYARMRSIVVQRTSPLPLMPAPEPASLPMLAGLASAAMLRRRRVR
jgi:hypothetical protein